MLRTVFFAAILSWFLLAPVRAQQPQASPNKPAALAQGLFQGGALNCAARADQIAKFLSPEGQELTILQMPPVAPDQSLIPATLLIPLGAQQVAVADVSLAPRQANGCGAVYRMVSYHGKSCEDTLKEFFPGLKTQALTKTGLEMGNVSRTLRVTAMKAGPGCVLMKQELVE